MWLFGLGSFITSLKYGYIYSKTLIFMMIVGGATVRAYKFKIEKNVNAASSIIQRPFYQKLLMFVFWCMALLPLAVCIIASLVLRRP
jgi:hypothetical protein